ncbi:unnamed protein product [Parajaminaea phylloscopi]
MSSVRRFHGPGVGGRTGMRVAEDVRSISGFLEAGRRAMDEHEQDESLPESSRSRESNGHSRRMRSSTPIDIDDDDDDDHYDGGYGDDRYDSDGDADHPGSGPSSPKQSDTTPRLARSSELTRIPGSSSMAMDLENSYAPSPDSRRISRGIGEDTTRRGPISNGRSISDQGSFIDHGSEHGDDYGDDDDHDGGRGSDAYSRRQSIRDRDDPGSRTALSIGLNRGRASGISEVESRRQSRYDISSSRPEFERDEPPSMMDIGAGEIPSFHVDDSRSDTSRDPRGNSASGDEADDFLGPGSLTEHDGHDRADDSADAANLTVQAAEEDPPPPPKRKRGRPPKDKSKASHPVGKGQPSAVERGAMVKERVASSRGRAGSVMDGDVRRSTRHRYAPLEWWRGERAIYGRPSSRRARRPDSADAGDAADETIDENVFEDAPVKSYCAPVLKEIIRFTRAPNEGTFTGMHIRKKVGHPGPGRPPKRKQRAIKAEHDDEDGRGSVQSADEDDDLDPTAPTRHVEDGWDEGTETIGLVYDVDLKQEVERVIACPASRLQVQQATNRSFAFQKVFGVDDYMAAGILDIPVDGEKPTKFTKDNNYTFVVMEGAIDVQVYRSMFRLAPGGMWVVPKGNTYSIRNCCQRRARVFFAQSRQAFSLPEPVNGVQVHGALRLDAPVPSSSPGTFDESIDRSYALQSQPRSQLPVISEVDGSPSRQDSQAPPTNGHANGPKKRGRPPKTRPAAE